MQYGPVSRIRNTHNNFCICPQMTMDYDLEEKLHDIDEFIESELGFPPLSARGTLSPAEINDLSFFLQSSDFSNGYHPGNNPGNMEASLAATVTKVPEVEVEVQIIDLKEVYDKKTKKTLEGLEYRLDDSEVTVVVQASETITSVRAFTQRCPEAAMRTHDTIGPVELDVHIRQNYGGTRRVLTVDLGSVYKTEDGDAFYWLEKAEVLLRNKWELIIEMSFGSGLAGSVKSRPFRVTTKSQYKMKKNGEFVTSPGKVQRILRTITESSKSTPVRGDCKFIADRGFGKDFSDDTSVLSQDFKAFSVVKEEDYTGEPDCNLNSTSLPSAEERIHLQLNTVLDRHMITTFYGADRRIRYVIEQPELPALLKLVCKSSRMTGPRPKANGHKSADEDFTWSCGFCFFERRKKSTIKAHLIQKVCRKTVDHKKSKADSVAKRLMKRNHSCSELEADRFYFSWKDSLSV